MRGVGFILCYHVRAAVPASIGQRMEIASDARDSLSLNEKSGALGVWGWGVGGVIILTVTMMDISSIIGKQTSVTDETMSHNLTPEMYSSSDIASSTGF